MTEPRRTHDPAELYSVRQIAVAALLLPVAVGALAILVTYPLAAVAAVAIAASVSRLARLALRDRRTGASKRLCIPGTRTCLEV